MRLFISILSLLFILTSGKASAQSSTTEVQQVDITLTNVITLKFSSTGTSTGSAATMSIANLSNYTNGVTSSTYQLTANSTKGFNVQVKTNAANFTYTGSYTSGTTMPVSNKLLLKVTANATGGSIAGSFSNFATLSSSNQNLITGCTNGTSKTFSIQYKANPGLAYPAGTYTTTVTYTVTQQ
jgi:hypothetical protein